jgi:hypothetical protein
MARIAAYYVHHPAAADDLAVFANSPDAGSYFHGRLTQMSYYDAKHSSIKALAYIMQGPVDREKNKFCHVFSRFNVLYPAYWWSDGGDW